MGKETPGAVVPAASPAPSTGTGNTGASPTPTSNSRSDAVSSFAGKLSGKPQESSTIQPAAPINKQPSETIGDLTDEQLFEKYGERIFKSPQYLELDDYKTKVSPVVDGFEGGIESLQNFTKVVGPLWHHITSLGSEKGLERWNKLLPLLSAVVAGEEIAPQLFQRLYPMGDSAPAEEPNELVKAIQPLESEIKSLKQEREDEKRQRVEQEKVEHANRISENTNKYLSSFDELMKSHKITSPEAKEYAWKLAIDNIIQHTGKGPDGKPINPLTKFNEAALKACIEKDILPRLKKLKLDSIDELKTETNTGPAIPNANGGPAPVQPPSFGSRSERIATMATRIAGSRP